MLLKSPDKIQTPVYRRLPNHQKNKSFGGVNLTPEPNQKYDFNLNNLNQEKTGGLTLNPMNSSNLRKKSLPKLRTSEVSKEKIILNETKPEKEKYGRRIEYSNERREKIIERKDTKDKNDIRDRDSRAISKDRENKKDNDRNKYNLFIEKNEKSEKSIVIRASSKEKGKNSLGLDLEKRGNSRENHEKLVKRELTKEEKNNILLKLNNYHQEQEMFIAKNSEKS